MSVSTEKCLSIPGDWESNHLLFTEFYFSLSLTIRQTIFCTTIRTNNSPHSAVTAVHALEIIITNDSFIFAVNIWVEVLLLRKINNNAMNKLVAVFCSTFFVVLRNGGS